MITANTPVSWSTIEYRQWFGSPRIHNPMVIFNEARPTLKSYMKPSLKDFVTCTMQHGHVIDHALEDPDSDARSVLQSVLDVMRAYASQGVFVPDREAPRPTVPIRARRKGRRA